MASPKPPHPLPSTEVDVADLRIRDPFILADAATQTYYLYRQIANGRGDTVDDVRGVEVFQSRDLLRWTAPQIVFQQPPGFWANAQVWAPEVHYCLGRYYMLVTFSTDRSLNPPGQPFLPMRGTQILVADSPLGPFRPFDNCAATPAAWSSLDGTLWVEDGVPWMVFCHEWTQITDGTVELLRLTPDLAAPVGRPQQLFRASDAPWARNLRDVGHDANGTVTDGPFVYRTRAGTLLMIWSSFGDHQYAVGVAESVTGKITGPWRHHSTPLITADGGHAMLFTDFHGRLTLCFHQPNQRQAERMKLVHVEDAGTTLRIVS